METWIGEVRYLPAEIQLSRFWLSWPLEAGLVPKLCGYRQGGKAFGERVEDVLPK